MSCSDSCPCKQSQGTPFYCHCSGEPYSQMYRVPLGHEGSARIFDICNPDIAGVGIEQAIIAGGSRVERDASGKCRIVCLKTSKKWYPYKEIERCCHDCDMLKYRPWILCPRTSSDEIVLPGGCYRFVAYDCDYNLIVPGPQDIAMLLTVEKC